MPKSAHILNERVISVFIFVSILFILLLTSINIEKYFQPKRVLGVETKVENNTEFWESLLERNPNYIPGWVELGRKDKVQSIDPNYF